MRPKNDSFKYDVALSFAGEDRKAAENLARALRSKGVSVFYDDFLRASYGVRA